MPVEEGRPTADGPEFLRSYVSRGILLVKLRKGSMASISGLVNGLQKKIHAATERKAVFFEEGEPLRAVSERLLYPGKISSARTSWLPDGTNQTVLGVVGKTDVDLKEAARLLSELYGVELNITSKALT